MDNNVIMIVAFGAILQEGCFFLSSSMLYNMHFVIMYSSVPIWPNFPLSLHQACWENQNGATWRSCIEPSSFVNLPWLQEIPLYLYSGRLRRLYNTLFYSVLKSCNILVRSHSWLLGNFLFSHPFLGQTQELVQLFSRTRINYLMQGCCSTECIMTCHPGLSVFSRTAKQQSSTLLGWD